MKKGFDVHNEVVVVTGDARRQGFITEVKHHTGICEVLVDDVVHYFFLETGHSVEGDSMWLELATNPVIEECSKCHTDEVIVEACYAARVACKEKDDKREILKIARSLCLCREKSHSSSVEDLLDDCLNAKNIRDHLIAFALGTDIKPSLERINLIKELLKLK